MSSQFRYLLTPEQVITTLLRAHPEAEAMEIAVGGDFERIGVLEHALMREAGLRPDSQVVDVGCGAGRLAVQLARHPGLRYLGTDVVPAVLDHARRRAGRPDFRFIHVDRVSIPSADGSVDMVCFFSVLTHLLHEESFLYLQEAHRVLKPGGKIVFSFFEHATAVGEVVFAANLDWVRKRIVASQLNIFLHRSDIRLWARRIGFRVEALRDGEIGSVTVGPAEATQAVPAGPHAFGQSICVLRKLSADELGDETEETAEPAAPPPKGRRRADPADPDSRGRRAAADATREARRIARRKAREAGTGDSEKGSSAAVPPRRGTTARPEAKPVRDEDAVGQRSRRSERRATQDQMAADGPKGVHPQRTRRRD